LAVPAATGASKTIGAEVLLPLGSAASPRAVPATTGAFTRLCTQQAARAASRAHSTPPLLLAAAFKEELRALGGESRLAEVPRVPPVRPKVRHKLPLNETR
ncbi:unnamed protein product, partial [Polarella glacialis]